MNGLCRFFPIRPSRCSICQARLLFGNGKTGDSLYVPPNMSFRAASWKSWAAGKLAIVLLTVPGSATVTFLGGPITRADLWTLPAAEHAKWWPEGVLNTVTEDAFSLELQRVEGGNLWNPIHLWEERPRRSSPPWSAEWRNQLQSLDRPFRFAIDTTQAPLSRSFQLDTGFLRYYRGISLSPDF